MPGSEVARVERMVSTFVLGYAICEAGGRFAGRDWRERRALLEGVDLPAHRKLANQLATPWSWDAEFEADLDDLVRLVENVAEHSQDSVRSAPVCSDQLRGHGRRAMPEASQTGPPDLAPLPPRPRGRRRVARLRILVRLSAGIMAAAGITIIVVVVNRPAGASPVYTGLPKPCTMVPEPRQVIKNMAEPPGGIVQVAGQQVTGTCDWIAVAANSQPETLQLEVDLHESPSGVKAAQKAYGSQAQAVSSSEPPNGITQVTWTAPGLGDQAIGQTWYGAPTAHESEVSVWVQSGNADIYLSLWTHWSRSASEYSAELPVMGMARDVLAGLAKHAR
ncbi:MAG TPA: hypothetical protein VME19_06145 [Streptosporangiaceae bacterium]|nr:hypothetical protein [Streptosporangiaceae bacterium]